MAIERRRNMIAFDCFLLIYSGERVLCEFEKPLLFVDDVMKVTI